MKRKLLIFSLGVICLSACAQVKYAAKGKLNAVAQTNLMLKELEDMGIPKGELVSPRTLENGELKLVASKDWTSGFFPGELWYLYEMGLGEQYKVAAGRYTTFIEKEKTNGVTHDMGFKIYCSVGNGFRLTQDSHYKEVLIESARTLSTRFNPKVGLIRSWDHHKEQWDYPVIIDNMLNLELLFEATRLTGDSSFYKIAVSHADKTMQNHFRSDYSTYHVVDYNPATGLPQKKQTHQGYSDSSAWARGQGWALYGFTMCYRETHNPKYLAQAEHVAAYLFSHPNMPQDLIPYWDFNAPAIPNEPRDVSAATVIASGLYELSTYSTKGKEYLARANTIMKNVTEKYMAAPGTAKGFILLHSTGSKPANSEIDVPLSYADYYYLEAMSRAIRLSRKKPVVD